MDKNFAENELIAAAIKDKDALLKVLEKYVPLVKSCAVCFVGSGAEFEDLVQEGMLGLVSAVRTFDPTKASFPTFAKVCVVRALCAAVRSFDNKSTIPAELVNYVDESELVDSSSDPAFYLSVREEYFETLKNVKEKLSAFEYSVFLDRLFGYTNEEIAKKHCTAKKAVENAYLRAHKKIKTITVDSPE